jgi:hypothetical protein
MEQGLDWLIWSLIGGRPAMGTVVTRRMGWAMKLSLLKRLVSARIRDPVLRDQLDSWRIRAGKAQDRRNEFVHRAWLQTEDAPPDTFVQFTYSGDGGRCCHDAA